MSYDLSFETMMLAAKYFPGLALATSFIQVEYGILELEAHWAGFVDSISGHNLDEVDALTLYNSFTEGLEDYIEISMSTPF